MLIQFVVENYLSFRKREVFSMRASKNVSRNAGPADLVQNTDILRCAALYGANAAGKSNFVRALDFARSMVLEGTKEGQDIDVHPFQLSKETRDAPVILEIYVRAMSGKIYGYGFSATRRAIQREWLTEVRDGSERLVFEREVGKFHFAARGKNLAYLRNIQVGVRDNQLFLHLARLLKIESFPIAIREVVEWFGSCLQIIQPHTQYGVLVPMLSAFDSFRQFMGAVLRQADTGINGLHLQERRLGQSLEGVAKGRLDLLKFGEKLVVMDTEQGRICYIRDASDWVELSLRFTHRTESGEADLQLENESDGTIRLLDLAPILYYAQGHQLEGEANVRGQKPVVFVIDELDRSLHTSVCRWLIERFVLEAKGSESQLIFTTHDTNLLDVQVLEPDAFWFTEKGADGGSALFSLAEFKDEQISQLRKDLEKSYLIGRFGGIPHLRGIKGA